MKRTRRGREERDRERDGSSSSGTISVRGEILLYFNLLRLVLFHGPQFKWRTFMMQMQAGAINLSCFPLLGSPDAKDVRSLSPPLFVSPSLSLAHWHIQALFGTLPHFLSTAAASCYTRPQATWKMNQAQVMQWGGGRGWGECQRGVRKREKQRGRVRERERERPQKAALWLSTTTSRSL